MSPLAGEPVERFAELVASSAPAPGGGGVAAVASALAAGLVEMAAAFTLARDEYADRHPRMRDVRDRAAILRERALPLADRDAAAYGQVIAAYGIPRDAADRAERVRLALSAAADVPLQIAVVAAEAAELGAELVAAGNRNLRGDALTAVLVGEAAAAAAAGLVEANLAHAPSDPRLARAREQAARAAGARSRAAPR